MKGGLKTQEKTEEWEQEKVTINKYLDLHSLELYDVEGDGNCLFYAIADQVSLRGESINLQRFLEPLLLNNYKRMNSINHL